MQGAAESLQRWRPELYTSVLRPPLSRLPRFVHFVVDLFHFFRRVAHSIYLNDMSAIRKFYAKMPKIYMPS